MSCWRIQNRLKVCDKCHSLVGTTWSCWWVLMWWQICIHLQVVVSGVGSIVTVNWYCSVLQIILAGLKSQQSQKNRQLTARWCSFQEPGKLSLSKHGLYLSNPQVYHHILIRSPQENMAIQWFPKYIYQYIYIYIFNYIYII